MSRLFIYIDDVQRLTGRGRKVAGRLLAEVRKKSNKGTYEMVTVIEFCEHLGLDLQLVMEGLK